MKNSRVVLHTTGMIGLTLLGAQTDVAAQSQPARVECSDIAQSLAKDFKGRYLVGGTAYDNRIVRWEDGGHAHYGDLAVSRLLTDGSVDTSFGTRGTTLLDVSDFDDVTAVLPRIGGIDIGGSTASLVGDRRGARDALVWRLEHDGAADTAFAQGGVARLDLGGDEHVATVSPALEGGVYVIGTTTSEGVADGFVARYTRAGALDARFGQHGVVRLDLGSDGDELVGGRTLLAGVVVAGRSVRDGEAAAVVLRLDARGRLVSYFGENGMAVAKIGGAPAGGGASSHSLFGGSAVSLAKNLEDGTTRVATVVFDAWGHIQPAAGGSAFEIDAPSGPADSVNAAERYWGSLYLAGASYPESFATGDAFITRVESDGVPAAEFGGIISEHYELEYAAFNDLAVDASGVTAVGWDFSETQEDLPRSDALLVRYRHDGTLDERFGEGGVLLHDFRGGEALCEPLTIVGESEHDHAH
jgi:uncharacterized delta-60 repeat protein